MKCPCCEAAEVSSATEICHVCGYSTKAAVATAAGRSVDKRGGPDPAKATVKVPKTVESGHVVAISILLKDSTGKRLKSGGDKVIVAVNGANRARPNVSDVKNGSYTATYTPTVAGADRISITANGLPVSGSPFTVEVTPGPADANRTTVKAPEGVTGEETAVVVELFDAHENRAASDGVSLVAAIRGANRDAAVTVEEQSSGVFLAAYVPALTGVDQVSVELNGKEVAGSPFKTTVVPGKSSPSHTEVIVPSTGVSGQGSTITIKTRDAYGNEKLSGGDVVEVSAKQTENSKLTVRDIGDGTYTALYSPTSPGTDEISVKLNGEKVAGSPFSIDVESGQPDPSQATTTIESGVAGDPSTITVTVRDQRGNPLPGRIEGLTVSVSGANTAEPELKETMDGVYSAVYVPTAVGSDEVKIVVDGQEIPGSPFDVTVEAGEVDPEQTTVDAPSVGVAGESVEFVLTTFDAFGNHEPSGTVEIELIVTGDNDGADVEVRDRHDGSYSASYVPRLAGTDELSVTVNGVDVTDPPLEVSITTSTASAAETTVEVGDGRAGTETQITIVTRDRFGNPVNSGGESVTLQVGGVNVRDDVTVQDNGDGTYSAVYLPSETGTDYVTVSLNGEMIADSPCASTVTAGAADPTQTTATAPSSSRAGSLTNVSVVVQDAFGNRSTATEEDITVTIEGPNEGAKMSIEGSEGSYIAKFTPLKAGTDEIIIALGGEPINDSPLVLEVEAADVDPVKSGAEGPEHGRVGEPYTFTVTARDKFDNCCGTGKHKVEVDVTGVNDGATVELVDNEDGTYTGSYEPATPGSDRLSVKINGVHIGGKPVRPKIEVGGASSASTVEVSDGRVGKGTTIKVVARDAAGNALESGGDAVLVNVSVANSNTPTVEDHGDGTYVAVYTPTRVGSDYVNVTVNGSPVKGGPFVSEVSAGPMDPGRTRVVVPSVGAAGRSSEIVIQARDLHGNEIQHGGQQFRVVVEGANDGSVAELADRADGTYVASYTPTKAGTDHIKVTAPGGEGVGGGAYKSEVEPGEPSIKQTTAVFPDGIVGMLTRISVTARDAYRNPTSAGAVQITLDGANRTTSLQVTDHRDGTYTATYTPTTAGEDRLIVLVDGESIVESDLAATVHAGPGASDRALVEVGEGVCGRETVIHVVARDEFGNEARRGGDVVTVNVDGPNAGARVRCSDNGDGTYDARYTPKATGTDLLEIHMNGEAIERSPFKTVVKAGEVDSGKCDINVPAGTIGVETTIRIVARDAYGNAITHGGADVAASIQGANVNAEVDVVDYDDGNYVVRYTPRESGIDHIDITIEERPAAGNPLKSVVAGAVVTEYEESAEAVGEESQPDEEAPVETSPSIADQVTQVIVPVPAEITEAETVEIDALPAESDAAEHEGDVEEGTDELEPVTTPSVAVDRSMLHPVVTCPRCSSATIGSDRDRCDLCGWEIVTLAPMLASRVADVPEVPSGPRDIDEKVAALLGDQFEVSTVLSRGDTWLMAMANFSGTDDPVLVRIVQRPEGDDVAERFRHDAARMKAVKHPRIIPLLRAGSSGDLMWYSTRLVRGQTLRAHLQSSGPLPVDAGVRIFQQITDALEYMHRSGLRHGSLTTNSIVLDENSEAWLALGILTGFEAMGEEARLEYMPPESFEGAEANAQADQYALAVCAYESLSGAKPFTGGKTAEDFASMHQQRVPPRVSELRRELPLHVATAIQRGMDKDPSRRFESILDFGKALSSPGEIRPLRVPARTGKRSETRVFVIERPLRPFPIRRIGIAATMTLMSFGTVEFVNRPPETDWETVEIETTTDPLENPAAATIDSLTALLDSTSQRQDPAPPQRRPPRTVVIDNRPGLLWVNSRPIGQLFVDGQYVGSTPLSSIAVTPGRHTIRVVQSGFQDHEQEIDISPGDSLRITDITLRPR